MSSSFNKNLLLITVAVVLILGLRMLPVAIEQNNWRGFGYSLLHVLIVAIGSFLAIRKAPENSN